MIFIDTDVLLDVAWEREPFHHSAATILAAIHSNEIKGGTTPIVLTNIYYLLRKENDDRTASGFVSRLMEILQFIPVIEADFKQALTSTFKDKEDAINHYAALSAGCDLIITRNVRDFRHAEIEVLTAEEFVLRD